MKRKCMLFLMLGLLCSFVSAPEANAKLKISDTKVTLGVGDSYYLYLGSYYEPKDAEWVSSNKKVATVKKDKYGYCDITVKKLGKTTITATYKGKKYTCKLTVKKPGFTYSYNKKQKTAKVTGYWGKHKNNTLKIPAKVKGYTVTAIGSGACAGGDFQKVVLPDTITKIDSYAFCFCKELKSVVWSSNLQTIGYASFGECSKLRQVVLPQSVKTIKDEAFYSCSNLTKLKLPNGIKKIGEGAFEECNSLTELSIPNDSVKLGEEAFAGCSKLKTIRMLDTFTNLDSSTFEGTKWIKNRRKENPLVIVNTVVIDGYKCKGDVVIPEGVTKIAAYAFAYCDKITSLTLPGSVVKIDHGAIDECKALKKIVIPNPQVSMYNDSINKYYNYDKGKYNKLTIYAPENSMGHHFAQLSEIAFQPLILQ